MLSLAVRHRIPARVCCFGLCIGLLVSVGRVRTVNAQAGAKAAAEALFDRGLDLMRQGKFAEACQQLESSQSMDPAVGTMLYLAECYEKQGRIASAWALFREAASAARAAGQLERARVGAQRANLLEPRLSTLIIEVPPDHRVDGMEVRRNGVKLPAASWGIAIPVDPHTHQLRVTAPGYVGWESEVKIESGTAQTSVAVPALEPLPQAPASTSTVAAVATPDTATPTPFPEAEGPAPALSMTRTGAEPGNATGDTQRLVGLIVGGAGVVTLGAATFFGVRAANKQADAENECGVVGDNICTRPENSSTADKHVEEAKDAAMISTVLTVGGVVATATGALLYLLAPSASEHVAFEVNPYQAALHVGGVF